MLAVGILLLILPAILNPYLLRVAIMVGIYMILASSLNIIIGFTASACPLRPEEIFRHHLKKLFH